MDFETILYWLVAIRDLLWAQYKDATDKQDIGDSYDRWMAQDDAIDLLVKQKEEIEQLKAENENISKRLKIMYNRCICFRGSANCSSCAQREECESKRSFYHEWHLVDHKRVRKEGEQE